MSNTSTRLIHHEDALFWGGDTSPQGWKKKKECCRLIEWRLGGVIWTTDKDNDVTCPACRELLAGEPEEIKPK
jgi:hypothetical protein